MPGWGPADPKNRTGRYASPTSAPSVFTVPDGNVGDALYDYNMTTVPPTEFIPNDNTLNSTPKDEQPMKSSFFVSNKVEPKSTSSPSNYGHVNEGFTYESTSL